MASLQQRRRRGGGGDMTFNGHWEKTLTAWSVAIRDSGRHVSIHLDVHLI
jgi:hypothetical protein